MAGLTRVFAALSMSFFQQTSVLPDPLYTGKMLRQLMFDIESGRFRRGAVILAVHTGGLQGWRGYLPHCADWFSAQTRAALRQVIETGEA